MSETKIGTVHSIAFGGEGVVREPDGRVVFIPYVAPEETVAYTISETKRTFARARLEVIQTPSPSRVQPLCPYFGTCQGCQFQHLTYEEQLRIKVQFVKEAFERIAKVTPPPLSITGCPTPYDYRHHIRLNLEKESEGFKAGYKVGSALLPIDICPIFSHTPIMKELAPLLSALDSSQIESASLRLFKLNSDQFLAAFSFYPDLPSNRAECLPLAPPSLTSIWMQAPKKREVFGPKEIYLPFGEEKLPLSPYVFSQNNLEMTQKLYDATLSHIPSSPHAILDLYCGIGLLSDRLAAFGHQVTGIESHPEAVHLAQARHKAKFIAGKVEDCLPQILRSQAKFETILVNPPREGLAPDVVDYLLILKPERILYTSCMPSTLARDVARFQGYEVTSLQLFDLFPQTTHLETLAVLERT